MSLPTNKQDRKERPVFSGLLDYFPDACAEVAHVSYVGNQQHNPGQPMHWARHKSTDHLDCIGRHLIEAGTEDDDGLLHSAKLAWRALANLQIELEAAGDAPQQIGVDLAKPAEPKPDPGTPRRVMLDRLIDLNCPPHIASQIVGGTTFREGQVNHGKVVYISGPMRGLPEDNFPAFDKARDEFAMAGWTVISPADVDRIGGRSTDNWVYIERDYYALKYVAKMNGAIAMLPGWESSKGAAGELFLSHWGGITILKVQPDGSRPMKPFDWSAWQLEKALDNTLLEQK